MEIADEVIRGAVVQIAATLVDVGEGLGHLTCTEVDELARSLALLGMQDEGESLILMHATGGDGQGDEAHGVLVDDNGESLVDGAQTMVRVYVEAMAGGAIEPGSGIDAQDEDEYDHSRAKEDARNAALED